MASIPVPVLVRLLVDKVTLGQVFLRVLRFSAVIIIPPMLPTPLYLHVAVNRRTNGRSLGAFQKQSYFGNGAHWIEKYFFLSLKELNISYVILGIVLRRTSEHIHCDYVHSESQLCVLINSLKYIVYVL